MSVARPFPLEPAVADRASRLLSAERRVALLDRVQPQNLAEERARLTQAYRRRERPPPAFVVARPPPLRDVRAELEEIGRGGETFEAELLAGRAEELSLEAELVESLGDVSRFRSLAARRFGDGGAALLRARASLATDPLATDPLVTAEELVESDSDEPRSLLSKTRARLEGSPSFRIELCEQLASVAAVASGIVRIRRGARLTEREAERIALHEVEGHLLPRSRGERLGGVFAAGAAGANDDEEGRALWLEERHGLASAERRLAIARRYLAAHAAREGATFWEIADVAREHGAAEADAVDLACRVVRGGGLAREGVYLSAFVRVEAAFRDDPSLEPWLAAGRVSVEAARKLREHAALSGPARP